jgi:hypothetical protein
VSTLHITNGDSAGDTLRSFLQDPVKITCDVLHDGPIVPAPAWLAAAAAEYDEVVFWFEHDLFDQLLLIRALDALQEQQNVSLICIDRFPGVEPFYGLGQLDAAQLATLTDTRAPITPDQYALAQHAWAAFGAADPRELAQVAHLTTSSTRARAVLPFLGDALTRFLAEYPSVAHGLSRTEELALSALRDGPTSAGALFGAAQSQERHPFMGDWSFYQILRRLHSARTPLLIVQDLTDDVDLRSLDVTITEAGRDVIEGQEDGVALNGIDRWLGGVHLIGPDRSPWRWDAWRETLVS